MTKRRGALSALILLLGSTALSNAWAESSSTETTFARWVATWTSAPVAPGTAPEPTRAFENQTIRHIVHVSVGGNRVRVRLSNVFGTQPLVVGAAHVAVHAGGASIVPGTDRKLTFGGRRSITIPAGGSVLSDPVPFYVRALSDLAASIYVPVNSGPATYHGVDVPAAYLSEPGNFAGAVQLPVSETLTSRFWLTAVEVDPIEHVRGAVVAIGDSITMGMPSTRAGDRNWPGFLSTRLNAPHSHHRLSAVNQGIGCNRLLLDVCGPSGLSRFQRDALSVAGVTHVIVAFGLVDFALPTVVGNPAEVVSSDQVISGLQELVAQARARGLKVYGATLTPCEESTFPNFWTPENEVKRQAVNEWIRTSGEFDGVVDADAAVRDPNRPTRMLPIYASADNTHPNDAGHAAIANSIDLSLLD
jgi:lysophospholipase L1-like esterase